MSHVTEHYRLDYSNKIDNIFKSSRIVSDWLKTFIYEPTFCCCLFTPRPSQRNGAQTYARNRAQISNVQMFPIERPGRSFPLERSQGNGQNIMPLCPNGHADAVHLKRNNQMGTFRFDGNVPDF